MTKKYFGNDRKKKKNKEIRQKYIFKKYRSKLFLKKKLKGACFYLKKKLQSNMHKKQSKMEYKN